MIQPWKVYLLVNPWSHALRREEKEAVLDTSAELLGTFVEELVVSLLVSSRRLLVILFCGPESACKR
ncbi:hypothetical protein EV2_032220 [Malus domestica]